MRTIIDHKWRHSVEADGELTEYEECRQVIYSLPSASQAKWHSVANGQKGHSAVQHVPLCLCSLLAATSQFSVIIDQKMQLTDWENANSMRNATCVDTQTLDEWPYCSFLHCANWIKTLQYSLASPRVRWLSCSSSLIATWRPCSIAEDLLEGAGGAHLGPGGVQRGAIFHDKAENIEIHIIHYNNKLSTLKCSNLKLW